MKPSRKSSTHIWKSGSYRRSWLRLAGFLAVSALGLLEAQRSRAATYYRVLNGTTANAVGPVTGNWNTVPSGTGGAPQASSTSADDLKRRALSL